MYAPASDPVFVIVTEPVAVWPIFIAAELKMAPEPELLASCHRRSLEVAGELGARSLAFPAISCGIYGYPLELAAPVAIEAVRGHELDLVRFVLFDEAAYDAFVTELDRA